MFVPRGTGCQSDLIHPMIKSYSLLTSQASAGQHFFLLYPNLNFQQKVPLSTKEGLFVINSLYNSLIHQEVLHSSATYSSTAMLFFLYLIFISQMSLASSDSQSREIYKEGIAFCIPSSLSDLANPLISKPLSCNQSNIFLSFRFAAETLKVNVF